MNEMIGWTKFKISFFSFLSFDDHLLFLRMTTYILWSPRYPSDHHKAQFSIPLFFLPFSLVLRRSLPLFLSIIPFQLCTISSLFFDDLLHQMTMQMKWTTNQEKYFWIGLFDWSTVFSFDTVETQQMIPFPTVLPFLPSENFIFLVVLHHKQRKLHKYLSLFIGSFNTIPSNRSLFFFTEHKSSLNKRFFFLHKIVFSFLFLVLAKLWNSLLFCSAR